MSVGVNGPGVPQVQQLLIFEKFCQGDIAVKRPHGTGLGLLISRQLIEHIGRQLRLVLLGGAGSCFEFHLRWTVPGAASAGEPEVHATPTPISSAVRSPHTAPDSGPVQAALR